MELQLVGAKTQVSQVHNELETSAYALVNLRAGYDWDNVTVDIGIENLLDTQYDLPLGGANLGGLAEIGGKAGLDRLAPGDVGLSVKSDHLNAGHLFTAGAATPVPR